MFFGFFRFYAGYPSIFEHTVIVDRCGFSISNKDVRRYFAAVYFATAVQDCSNSIHDKMTVNNSVSLRRRLKASPVAYPVSSKWSNYSACFLKDISPNSAKYELWAESGRYRCAAKNNSITAELLLIGADSAGQRGKCSSIPAVQP